MAQIKQDLTFSKDGEVTLTLDAPGISRLIVNEPMEDTETSVVKYVHTYYKTHSSCNEVVV